MSEVARLMQQIETECQAMKLLMNGFARVASHEIVNNRFRAISKAQEELAELVGEKEADRLSVDAYTRIVG